MARRYRALRGLHRVAPPVFELTPRRKSGEGLDLLSSPSLAFAAFSRAKTGKSRKIERISHFPTPSESQPVSPGSSDAPWKPTRLDGFRVWGFKSDTNAHATSPSTTGQPDIERYRDRQPSSQTARVRLVASRASAPDPEAPSRRRPLCVRPHANISRFARDGECATAHWSWGPERHRPLARSPTISRR